MPRSEMPGTPLEVPITEGTLARALALVRLLRVHCPWDAAQTANTLVPHLIEETHEVVDAIHDGDADTLEEELGDLLLNLAFQIVVAEEVVEEDEEDLKEEVEGLYKLQLPEQYQQENREQVL